MRSSERDQRHRDPARLIERLPRHRSAGIEQHDQIVRHRAGPGAGPRWHDGEQGMGTARRALGEDRHPGRVPRDRPADHDVAIERDRDVGEARAMACALGRAQQAASRCAIDVLLPCDMTSNHCHVAIHDCSGRYPELTAHGSSRPSRVRRGPPRSFRARDGTSEAQRRCASVQYQDLWTDIQHTASHQVVRSVRHRSVRLMQAPTCMGPLADDGRHDSCSSGGRRDGSPADELSAILRGHPWRRDPMPEGIRAWKRS